MNLSVIILTFNEEKNLPRCLESIKRLEAEVFVVDSGSTDATRELALKAGATVVSHEFKTHALQWEWALHNLPLQTDWILALDADQYLTPELATEITRMSPRVGTEGLYVNRRQIFRGRWIRHGAYYPKYLLKLFRRLSVCFDASDLVDHHFYVRGSTDRLRNDMVEENSKEDDITFWIAKHNRYAELMATEELRRRQTPATSPIRPRLFGSPDERILCLKALWRRLPLYVRPFLYFSYRYFFRFGWADGKQGFVFHFLQSFWFRLVVDIKIEELSQVGRDPGKIAGEHFDKPDSPRTPTLA